MAQPQVLEGDGPTGCDSSMLPPGSLRTAALCNIICHTQFNTWNELNKDQYDKEWHYLNSFKLKHYTFILSTLYDNYVSIYYDVSLSLTSSGWPS